MPEPNDDAPVELEFFARPEHLADVRKLVERLASRTPLTRAQRDELLTAVDEAAANAIRHGSPAGEKSLVRVVCHRLPTGLLVEVRDSGSGFAAAAATRAEMPGPDAAGGRGLPLMIALADSVEIASSPRGTTVTLKKAAPRR